MRSRSRFYSGCIAALVFTGVATPLFGADWSQWQDARALYDAGKYTEALRSFQSSPSEDATWYYNVGNVYYRLGQIGAGVAYLEKANRQRAHDPDIQHNLKLARAALERQISPELLDPASSWLETMTDNAPLDEIRGTLGLMAFILSLLWINSYRKVRSLKRTLLMPSGLIGVLALAITVSMYGAQRLASANPPACAIEQQLIRSGPGEQFIELGRVEPGEKVRLLGQVAQGGQAGQELWRQIRYSPDKIGWIKASSLLPL